MAKSISSPPILIDLEKTIPANEIIAISVVPPPISIIIFPAGSAMGSPTPIAAAIGSSIKNTDLAPARSAESRTALFSTSVIPEGIAITILGRTNTVLLCTFLIK